MKGNITMQESNNFFIEGNDATDEIETFDMLSEMRQINTDKADEKIYDLHNQKLRGRLDLQPDFQRQYVWDAQKATSLIESALLRIPLPVIYLAEEQEGKRSVIDGQQRLTSFFSFIDGRFPDGREFRLKKMQVYTEFSGLRFDELKEEYQDRIQQCSIRTITFLKGTNEQLKFNIFERLNSGAMALNDQELRNCIYRGSYNTLLKELAEYNDFKLLIGIKNCERRLFNVELVLRFCAFLNTPYYEYKSPIKSFLNREMRENRSISEEKLANIRDAFKNSVSIIKMILGEKAFRRYIPGNVNNHAGEWEPKKFNVSLYDILMFSFARRDKNLIMRHAEEIRDAYIELMTMDEEFLESITRASSNAKMVNIRFKKWLTRLDEILAEDQEQPRFFTAEFKKNLFEQNPICEICHQRILSLDDAAVDHIVQYWQGGKTIPENARLTHRFCNCARKRNEAFSENLNLGSDEIEKNEKLFTKEPSTLLISFSNGTIIHEDKAVDSFVKFIQTVGVERVISLNLLMDRQPLILPDSVAFEKPAQATSLGDGHNVNSHSSTREKSRLIEKIAYALGINVTVELKPKSTNCKQKEGKC